MSEIWLQRQTVNVACTRSYNTQQSDIIKFYVPLNWWLEYIIVYLFIYLLRCVGVIASSTGRTVQGSNPSSDRKFFLFHKTVNAGSGTHPGSRSIGYHSSFPWVWGTGRQADCSTPSSVEVKSEWSSASAPPICFHGEDRHNFASQLLFIR
jgi:hypothetical protein